MRRSVWLILAAALIVVVLIASTSLNQCKITRDELSLSPVQGFFVRTLEGYAIGFKFNMTNGSNCQLTAQSIQVTLRDATFQDGSQKTFGTTESQSISQSMTPGQASLFSYAFTQYFDLKPVKMSLLVVITLSGAGDMTVYDGDVTIPAG